MKWAHATQQDFTTTQHQVWVINGENDRMVPTKGSYDLAQRIPNAKLTIYPLAGHGAKPKPFSHDFIITHYASFSNITI